MAPADTEDIEPSQDIVDEDFTYIRKLIIDITKDLADYLVREHYETQSNSLAKARYYLNGNDDDEEELEEEKGKEEVERKKEEEDFDLSVQVKSKTPDDEQDKEEEKKKEKEKKINAKRKLLPKFLMVIAPREPVGSQLRENEIRKRKSEGRNFLLQAFGQEIAHKDCVVNTYLEMKNEVKEFCISEAKLSNMPFVVFLGHGDKSGHLVFFDDTPRPSSKQTLEDMKNIFLANKAPDMPDFQLRVVFAQCFAHMGGGKRGKVHLL